MYMEMGLHDILNVETLSGRSGQQVQFSSIQ